MIQSDVFTGTAFNDSKVNRNDIIDNTDDKSWTESSQDSNEYS